MVDVHAIIEAEKRRARAEILARMVNETRRQQLTAQANILAQQNARKEQPEQKTFMQGVKKRIIKRFEQR